MGSMADNVRDKKHINVPKHANEMSKDELEETLKKKKECNAQALQIVESMLEISVDKDWFLKHLKYIRQNHFEDIIEERAIMKVCGYPLCSKKLEDVPSHQYHISIKSKKVYDITERKKFCSNFCYKAAKYLEEQLLTSPLWFGDTDEKCIIKLMTNDSPGIIGKEITIDQNLESKDNQTKSESDFLSINQFAVNSVVNISPETNSVIEKDKHNEMQVKCPILEQPHSSSVFKKENQHENAARDVVDNRVENVSRDAIEIEERKSGREPVDTRVGNMSRDVIEIDTSALLNENVCIEIKKRYPKIKVVARKDRAEENVVRKLRVKGTESLEQLRPAQHLEKCLNEWFNLETIIYLFGETKTKELIVAKGKSIKEYNTAVRNSPWDPKLHDRYEKICKRLNLMDLEDIQFDEKLKEIGQLKPLPDYRDIQEDGKKMELKVNAFYQGKTVYAENPSSSSQFSDGGGVDSLVPDNLMPLVDLHSQKALRRRIVIDKLKKVLSDLLRTFGFTSSDVINEVRAVVNTFSLEAHNITFKPAEWTLLGLIIIKMLAVKNPHIAEQLHSKQANKHHAAILSGFQEKNDYIERLIDCLTDIDNVLK